MVTVKDKLPQASFFLLLWPVCVFSPGWTVLSHRSNWHGIYKKLTSESTKHGKQLTEKKKINTYTYKTGFEIYIKYRKEGNILLFMVIIYYDVRYMVKDHYMGNYFICIIPQTG